MLRVSATTTSTDIDLQAINGDANSAALGIEYGAQLMEFAESVVMRDVQSLRDSRQRLLEIAGPAVLVDAAGVAANFQRMVRIADSIGIPVDDMSGELGQQIRADLSLEKFASAQNTLEPSGTSLVDHG